MSILLRSPWLTHSKFVQSSTRCSSVVPTINSQSVHSWSISEPSLNFFLLNRCSGPCRCSEVDSSRSFRKDRDFFSNGPLEALRRSVTRKGDLGGGKLWMLLWREGGVRDLIRRGDLTGEVFLGGGDWGLSTDVALDGSTIGPIRYVQRAHFCAVLWYKGAHLFLVVH
jgi:hypothetical protein